MLGPFLFNIFINDLIFACKEDICNFADDSTMYVCSFKLNDILLRIDHETKLQLSWFKNNGTVANPEKFQVGNRIPININITINKFTICSSREVKLLELTIDRQLSFLPLMQNICEKVLSKTRALMRTQNFLNQKQADILFSSHLMSP